MTPTLILFVVLFWTLPVSVAVLTYRRHNSSTENVKSTLKRSTEGTSDALSPHAQLQPDA